MNWIFGVAVVLVFAAVMLVADIGAATLWFAVIAIGIAIVAIDASRRRHT